MDDRYGATQLANAQTGLLIRMVERYPGTVERLAKT
jgi:hypothetical protein